MGDGNQSHCQLSLPQSVLRIKRHLVNRATTLDSRLHVGSRSTTFLKAEGCIRDSCLEQTPMRILAAEVGLGRGTRRGFSRLRGGRGRRGRRGGADRVLGGWIGRRWVRGKNC